ncbi:MAG: prolipoprotein diacylglyceryl transferase [Ruminococcaceae bacterium]|nr:prolipoprotein diacylglyceryl transferase [Oscillospiraceae bacterium]
MYALIQGIAMLIYVIVLTLYGKAYGFSRPKSFILGFLAVSIDYVVILLMTWVENGFQGFGAQNAVRVFVFNPLLIYIVAKIMKVDFRKYLDYNAFPGMLWYGLGHFACLTTGCCQSFTYKEGSFMYDIAHALTGTGMLPQQILESVGALLIAGILLAVGIKYKFKTNGYMYLIMLMLYGTQRFFFEFFRDNEKLIVIKDMVSANGQIGISNLAFWAAAMAIEGAILLAVMVIYDKKHKKAEIEIPAQA